MSFTKRVVVFGFSLVLAFLMLWWSGAMRVMGAGGPLDFLGSITSLIPGWLWGIAILFVVGGIVIDRIF